MAVEALKKVFQAPVIKRGKEPPLGRKRPKPQKKAKKKEQGRIDIKV